MKLFNHECYCEECGKDTRGLMGSPCTESYCVTKGVYLKDGTVFGVPIKKGDKK